MNELPSDFTEHSFRDKNYKINDGESLNDMDIRFKYFIDEIIEKNDKSIIVIHGIMLLSYLQNHCEFELKNGKTYVSFNGKEIIKEKPKSPGVYQIMFDDNKNIVNIDILN